MAVPRPLIADLFAAFEKCLSTPGDDVTRFYADAFVFAGPDGARALNRDAFARALPGRDAFFRSLGLVGSRITGVDEMILDERYSLVRTTWAMTFRRDDDRMEEIPLAASYLVDTGSATPRFIAQLDHQDFVERVRHP